MLITSFQFFFAMKVFEIGIEYEPKTSTSLLAFGTKEDSSESTCANPRVDIRSATQSRPEIYPKNMHSKPRETASSAKTDDLITCPDPISREASARKIILIGIKSMIYTLFRK